MDVRIRKLYIHLEITCASHNNFGITIDLVHRERDNKIKMNNVSSIIYRISLKKYVIVLLLITHNEIHIYIIILYTTYHYFVKISYIILYTYDYAN